MTSSSPTNESLPSASWNKEFLRIGHAGAGALAPPNTLKSLALAIDLGVDMVEFDVRPCRDALILLHDPDLSHLGGKGLASETSYAEICTLDAGGGERIPTLAQALDLIGSRALMCVDLKGPGYESPVIETLRAKGVLGNILISSLDPGNLREIRRLDAAVRTSISYPEDRSNLSGRSSLQPAVTAALAFMRRVLPFRIMRMMAYAQANATTLYHRVISPATVRRVHSARGRVYAWTVDQAPRMAVVRAMGVDGITTNRPDLLNHVV